MQMIGRNAYLSINFILETLKDKLSLFVLVLSDSVLSVEFLLLSVEHVRTKVKNRPFIHFSSLALYITFLLPSLLVFS